MTVPIRGWRRATCCPAGWWTRSCSSPRSPADVEEAKALCRDCPIREACLAGALERREPWGVWGGELFVGGVVVARKRPRGRPRKYPLADPFAPAARDGRGGRMSRRGAGRRMIRRPAPAANRS